MTRKLTASMGLAAALLMAAVFATTAGPGNAAPATRATGAPSKLQVDDQAGPWLITIGDARPTFSWADHDSRRGSVQSAYEVEVRSGAQQLWDSGRVTGADTVDVPYGGPALTSNHSYTWAVRTWDGAQASPWSAPASFDTGLLSPADWSASWIGAPPPPSLSGADWIWYPEGQAGGASFPAETRYFRDTIDVPSGDTIKQAQVVMTADDGYTLYVNGTEVGQSPSVQNSWQQAQVFDVSSALHAGTNVIAVAATNASPSPAGLLGRIDVQPSSGSPITVLTDGSWKTSQQAPSGWQQPGFDESSWAQALVEAPYGIGPWGSGVSAPVRDPYLRHDFTLSKRVVRARFFAAAQGLYYAYLNGRRIGDDELDSTWTDWSARTLYRGFDVTHLLRSGANTLGVLLGQGQHSATGQAPEFLGQLDLTYADGTSAVIGTDGSWTTSPSPITNEDTYFGESYDARLRQPGWDSPGFDASAWQPVHVAGAASASDSPRLEADATPPIRTVATVSPVKETNPAPGVRVYDFGQNYSGWVRITASAPAGTTVDIKKGEILDSSGRVSTANISFAPSDPPRQTDHYTFRGSGSETYEPHFVYAGFRYAEITGLPDSANVTVAARVIHTDVQSAGTFTSSDPLLNEIEQATRQTQLNNLYGVPTDCPTREKKGWMRDGADAAAAAMDNFSMESFYANWLADMKTSQSANGSEPSVAPSTMFPNVYLDDPAWASAYPELLWSDYVRYGNKSLLAEHYDAIKGLVDYFGTIADSDHVIVNPQTSYGSDWQAPVSTPTPLYDTGFYYEDTEVLVRIARLLGNSADAASYSALAGKIASGFNSRFLNASGDSYGNGSQLSNAMPLMLGIVPSGDEQAVRNALINDIRAHSEHLTTGYVGTPIVLQTLQQLGMSDLLLAIAEKTDYPSVGYMLANGPGTLWEGWTNSKAANGTSSRDHIGLGAPFGAWLYEGLAGIQPDENAPGYAHFTLAPGAAGALHAAAATVQTPHGAVTSGWRRSGNRFSYRASVPVGATATIKLPLTGGADSTVTESGVTIFTGGHASHADPGLTVAGSSPTMLTLEASSGSYDFRVAPGGPAYDQLDVYAPTSLAASPGDSGDTVPVLVRGLATESTQATLTASAPSGWKVSFSPATFTLDGSGVWQDQDAQATITVPAGTASGNYKVALTAHAGTATSSSQLSVNVSQSKTLYTFEDGTAQGWQPGANVSSVAAVTSFANGPQTAYAGNYALDATCTSAPASSWHTVSVSPGSPLDLSSAKTFSVYEDSYGGVPNASGYEAMVTLTGADGQTLSKTFPTSSDTWNPLNLDVSSWPDRSQVSQIAVSFHAVGSTDPWGCHFQIDNVGWTG